MAILSLGVSFRRAPMELLERLSFADADLTKSYGGVHDLPGVHGAVIVSTCNRVEVIGEVDSYHAGFLGLKRLLVESGDIAPDELAEPLYSNWEHEAADHLFAVGAGLDSMVVGETQIHAQLRAAARRARAEDASTPALDGLFHAASRAGRRVRQETAVGAAPDAFVRTASELAEAFLADLEGLRVVVVGAGTMARLVVGDLRRRGVGALTIVNRSLEHARELAERASGDAVEMDALPRVMADADLVVSVTGAAGHVVREVDVRTATAGRAGRPPLVLVDLAIPRDVEPAVAGLGGIHLIDVLAIRKRIAASGGPAEAELARAREIVAEEVRRWVLRRRGDELAPLIRALRKRGDDVVRAELGRHASRLGDLTTDQAVAVDSLARAIAAKLLHDPIVELKERSEPGTGKAHARLLVELFRLDPDEPQA